MQASLRLIVLELPKPVVQSLSHVQLCDPMGCSRPGFPVHHQLRTLLKLRSIESVIPSNHLISVASFSSCTHLSQHQSFPISQHFPSGGQWIEILASVLPMNIQDWFPSGLTGLILLSKSLSGILSRTIVWKHQFFGTQPSLWYNSHIHTWLVEKPYLWLYGSLSEKWYLCLLICYLGLL